MSYCLTCGKGATSVGIGCISVGDGVHTQGAWQVSLGADISIEELGTDPKQIRDQISTVRGLLSLYQSFSDQGFAPKEFYPKAKAVLDHLVGVMTTRAEELEAEAPEEEPVEDVPKDKVEIMEEDVPPITAKTAKKKKNRNRK